MNVPYRDLGKSKETFSLVSATFFRYVAILWIVKVATAASPNVLFIVADDLNTTIGCYGGNVITPNLDALARSGLLFSRAYCQESVCGPSRNSVLSGLRPDTDHERIGRGNSAGPELRKLMPGAVTLPELFKRNGYHTVSIGKVYHHGEVETGGPVGPRMPRDELSWSDEPWYHGTPYQQWYEQESFDLTEKMRSIPATGRPRIIRGLPYESSQHPDDVYADGQIANQAILTLRRIKDQTFFMALGFRRPHLPFNCPKKYWDLYPESEFGLPDNYYPPRNVPKVALHDAYELRSYADIPASGPIPEQHTQNLVRGYKAAASYMDAQLGRVMAELEQLGLAENTLVMFWSDHGYHTGENSLWTKMTNFEIATRVPLIVRMPNQPTRGVQSAALVELVDLYPTLAELCELTPPDYLEGKSFAPLFRNPEQPWKEAVYSQFRRGLDSRENRPNRPLGRSMATALYRYTEWRTQEGESLGTELYNLKHDPQNNVNLAGLAEYDELVHRLSSQLGDSPLSR
ncbi:MAG: sulfatase [Pirellulaceae bacterium]|nr:sulfatase [Pirellulaceae bacterium]